MRRMRVPHPPHAVVGPVSQRRPTTSQRRVATLVGAFFSLECRLTT